MKITQAVFFIGVSNAKPSLMGGTDSAVAHQHTARVERAVSHRSKRSTGRKGFQPLAAMLMYMRGFDADNRDPRSHSDFESELEDLEDTYTNYGCYCWIDGVDAGVIGGGQTHDVTDHHCKELYRCYKCVKNDYSKSYSEVDYFVDFTTGSNGRELDCTVNAQQDAENICECDKRFAEAIAETEQLCLSDPAGADSSNGPYCMDESYRTTTGTVPGTSNAGSFDPKTCTDGHDHDSSSTGKDQCCGIYPNRYPYDENVEECCQKTVTNADTSQSTVFTLFQLHECAADNGVVVKNVDGDPHTYHAV